MGVPGERAGPAGWLRLKRLRGAGGRDRGTKRPGRRHTGEIALLHWDKKWEKFVREDQAKEAAAGYPEGGNR